MALATYLLDLPGLITPTGSVRRILLSFIVLLLLLFRSQGENHQFVLVEAGGEPDSLVFLFENTELLGGLVVDVEVFNFHEGLMGVEPTYTVLQTVTYAARSKPHYLVLRPTPCLGWMSPSPSRIVSVVMTMV